MATTDARTEQSAHLPARKHRPNVILAIVLLCQLMIGLDVTIVNIALPDVRADLNCSTTDLAWVFNAYTLAFGGLLLLGGRAGDILGRRVCFVGGVLIFTVASLAGGLATGPAWLIAARVVQGLGGAFAAPSVLALIATNFAEGPRRNRALGLFSAMFSVSLATGLILGGILTHYANWRWVFFINVPIGLAIAVLALLFIDETERRPGRFDMPGALLGTTGIGAVVYGFIRASAHGWSDSQTIGFCATGAVLVAVFVVNESRAAQPILPLRLFTDRNRAGAYINMLLVPTTLFDIIYFMTQFLRDIRGYSPVRTGLAFLPLTVAVFATVYAVPRLVQRFGTKVVMVAGAALATAAMLWLTQLHTDSGYLTAVLGPLLLAGIGVGLTTVPLTITILSGVAPQDTGAASGALQTMQWIGGGALGFAVLVTAFGTAIRDMGGAEGNDLPPDVQAHGIATAFAAGTGFTALAFLIALVVIRTIKPPTSR
ncbi:MFS transporter [Nocardia sp. NBC_01329]|uniref:MFS transporter n=1 Tax=Nocardia sp. NBC_01329 TaxID=2903594 RepID=UPI002E0F7954|nr:MFS transporter [Nocardia sp. NBC_01329]